MTIYAFLPLLSNNLDCLLCTSSIVILNYHLYLINLYLNIIYNFKFPFLKLFSLVPYDSVSW